ncbi:hypothetical protein LMG28727_07672 [Paraburkholderia kirstenboschensis]|uniref:hypothetical protein n=1 Tax=Paraburkholderia kirstenboschensis TaxID=1245436 RepID=UPI00191B26C7|nr:hypothetical protein [Paraburkholderia kirstenboschensis]CAD6562184.1 hypothetical protein LMG28727_07672 [Paraburkholderia kirstenboschensis]
MNVTTGTLASEELKFTPAIFSRDDGVLFSVYSLTFGYQAFTLSFEAACERLGAYNQERTQVLLAFQLNHPRIARAIKGKALLADGRRVVLEATDFIQN